MKLWDKELIRYGIIGASTTGIDLGIFFILCELCGLNATLSNAVSLFISLCYSYVVNKVLVFRIKSRKRIELVKEMGRFFGGRSFTVFLELFCVFFFSEYIGLDGFISKLLTQVVIFICNYLLSKFWAFKK